MFSMMVVDDEIHLVDSMVDTLDWSIYGIGEVFKAYSAMEALETLKINPIDIVITDIRMPEMCGMELIGQLSEQWPHIQIIIVSGHADFQYAQAAVRYGVTEYLLKPVSDDELTDAVMRIVEKLRSEREQFYSKARQQQLINQNLPMMRSNLLYDLLKGKKISHPALEQLSANYGIHFGRGDTVYLLLIRMEGRFVQYDYNDLSLIAFSILNMAEELLGHDFYVWHSRDAHDYLAVLLCPRLPASDSNQHDRAAAARKLVSQKAELLQRAVQFYLQGSISILISGEITFPEDLAASYRHCVSRFRNQIGEAEGMLIPYEDAASINRIQALSQLYEPLMLAQLMELGNWQAAREKLDRVIQELLTEWPDSHEHLLEVYYALAHTFVQFAHNNGYSLARISGKGDNYDHMAVPLRSVRSLQQWAQEMLSQLEAHLQASARDGRSRLILLINQYIEAHLGDNASLQAIADQVGLHPTYLSKLYKLETGQGISEYSHRLRMDKAIFLLKQPQYKIYEITELLGYQNPQYFSKLFKKDFGCTPQEYRDRLL
jgi:two-component system response regulator YesN